MTQDKYDVAIIGSGLAGAALAAVLARHGQRVVVFEAQTHPRFAIGESLILETSEIFRSLAHFYDVPELAYFSSENFMAYAGTTHGVKRHFGFLHHQSGQAHNPNHTLQAIIPKEPHGHEFHLYRQDTDYFMMSTAVKYGATVHQNCKVTQVKIEDDGVVVVASDMPPIRADYIVDAGGGRSLLAKQFGVRHTELQTHSRGMFTHMVNVPTFQESVGANRPYDLPFRMAEGTLHHVFDGGWLWVIPFNNHPEATNPLCSVGLLLDPRKHPPRDDLTPEQEFFDFIAQFPDIAAQFAGAKAVRKWARAPRLQYASTQVVGDRWALLGHAAGFIDPFYSKGLYAALSSVFVSAHLLIGAKKTGDYSAAAFADLERMTMNFGQSADGLIANSYRSFQRPELWQVYAVLWLLGAYTELLKLNMMRAQAGDDRQAYYEQLVTLKLVGGGFAEFEAITKQVDGLMAGVDATDEESVAGVIAGINRTLRAVEWMPDPFIALLDGKTYLPKNKIRLSLLKPNDGFMGKGDYKAHFFGNLTMLDLLRYGVKEKMRYARPYLTWQHKKQHRKRFR